VITPHRWPMCGAPTIEAIGHAPADPAAPAPHTEPPAQEPTQPGATLEAMSSVIALVTARLGEDSGSLPTRPRVADAW